ncbi:hypothetical protein C6Q14_20345 [Burkholderia ambifaria]|nr:hypothetical protein C6Q14_20345 [Burkholderia ambifaria]
MRAFSFVFLVVPACGRVTAEWRKPPARLPAGLEGLRVHAQPRPAGCRRVPSAPPENEKARLVRAFSFVFLVVPACGRVTHRCCAPLREIRDCIRPRLRYRGGMRS